MMPTWSNSKQATLKLSGERRRVQACIGGPVVLKFVWWRTIEQQLKNLGESVRTVRSKSWSEKWGWLRVPLTQFLGHIGWSLCRSGVYVPYKPGGHSGGIISLHQEIGFWPLHDKYPVKCTAESEVESQRKGTKGWNSYWRLGGWGGNSCFYQ